MEFLQDAMEGMSDAGSSVFGVDAVEMPWSDACVYHEHEPGVCHLAEDDEGAAAASPSQTPLRRSARSAKHLGLSNELSDDVFFSRGLQRGSGNSHAHRRV